jgi:flagellar protein FlgJ
MLNNVDTTAMDPRQLESLKLQAAKDPKRAIPEAARQFEQVFVQQVLKSMRSASLGSGVMDSDASKTFTSMLDQQLATSISKRSSKGGGIGLAPVIEKALMRTVAPKVGVAPADGMFPINRAPAMFTVNKVSASDPPANK